MAGFEVITEAMKFTMLLLIFVFAILSPIQGATLTFLNTADGGSTFLYSGSVQNNQQVNSGDYFVIFDFAGLVSGSGPSSDWVFNIQNDVAGHPDNPSITDATFTYAGSSIIGQPGQTPLGIFTLKTTPLDSSRDDTFLRRPVRAEATRVIR